MNVSVSLHLQNHYSIVTNMNLDKGFGGSRLLNTEGQVIGMNIENYSSGQMKNTGMSFTVPSSSIGTIIPSLAGSGYYLHPWLGAAGADVTQDIAKALNLTEPKGVPGDFGCEPQSG